MRSDYSEVFEAENEAVRQLTRTLAHRQRRTAEQHAPNAQVVYLPEAGHLIAGQTARVLEFLTPSTR